MIKTIIVEYKINDYNNVYVSLSNKTVDLLETYENMNFYKIRNPRNRYAVSTDYNQPNKYLYTIMSEYFYEIMNNEDEEKKRCYINNIKEYTNKEYMLNKYKLYKNGDIPISYFIEHTYLFNIFIDDDDIRREIILDIKKYKNGDN